MTNNNSQFVGAATCRPLRVCFMGTPDVAATTLQQLVNSTHEVVCVVTQPDKAVGRGGRVEFSPVKKLALELGLPVFQPAKISTELDLLDPYKPDVIVTCAFGQILRQNVLDYAPHGVINVHYSLLPKYRGSSPVQWAIMNGETVTGVTVAKTELALDSGDIILVEKAEISPTETAGELLTRLAPIGAKLLIKALDKLKESDSDLFTPQDHAAATHFPMLKKEDGRIDWSKSANEIANQVRAMNPWPVAYFMAKGEVIRVYQASIVAGNLPPVATARNLLVKCGDGNFLSLEKLQAPGGKVLSVRDFLNGRRITAEDIT